MTVAGNQVKMCADLLHLVACISLRTRSSYVSNKDRSMPTYRNIVRVFLGSPGDLKDERRVIRDVVIEFNSTWADPLGYQIELTGWEDTIAGYGRPQHIINQDVDRCDLFVGMIWRRWGTPPSKEGDYSSGFQEEYSRSLERREKTGTPEISLFIKNIPESQFQDPGPDLSSVLNFRQSIVEEKRILFQMFDSVRDIERLVTRCLANFVINLRSRDVSITTSETSSSLI